MSHAFKHTAALLLAFALALTGCRQKMTDTPRYEVYERSLFFDDSLSARPILDGTVARSAPRTDFYAGTNPYYDEEGVLRLGGTATSADYENRLVRAFPFEVTREVLERGQQRYNIYCAPCHGRTGNGQGMIVQRGLRAPVSYHTERLRNAPVGHFYNVITNGYGAMYSYKARVSPADRWAIVAYIRALQLSQHASLEDVPADRLNEMQVLGP